MRGKVKWGNPFKVGDIVKRKVDPEVLGSGRVIEIENKKQFCKVQWSSGATFYHYYGVLEFYENPIERIRRLYSENL